jgi:hypothetical protein
MVFLYDGGQKCPRNGTWFSYMMEDKNVLIMGTWFFYMMKDKNVLPVKKVGLNYSMISPYLNSSFFPFSQFILDSMFSFFHKGLIFTEFITQFFINDGCFTEQFCICTIQLIKYKLPI